MTTSPARRFPADNIPGTLYLLHFTRPVGNINRPRMHASHYLGWTGQVDVEQRVAQHRAGKGAAITKAAVAKGADLILVKTWPGTRNDERQLKQHGHFSDLCDCLNIQLHLPQRTA